MCTKRCWRKIAETCALGWQVIFSTLELLTPGIIRNTDKTSVPTELHIPSGSVMMIVFLLFLFFSVKSL